MLGAGRWGQVLGTHRGSVEDGSYRVEATKTAICWPFRKPSDGLEPSTPSLPFLLLRISETHWSCAFPAIRLVSPLVAPLRLKSPEPPRTALNLSPEPSPTESVVAVSVANMQASPGNAPGRLSSVQAGRACGWIGREARGGEHLQGPARLTRRRRIARICVCVTRRSPMRDEVRFRLPSSRPSSQRRADVRLALLLARNGQ